MSPNQISDADVLRLIDGKEWDTIITLLDQGKLDPNRKLAMQFFFERLTCYLLPMMVGDKANQVVRKLLEKGANPNQCDEFMECLSIAVETGNHEAIDLLLDAGADLEATAKADEDSGGETALLLAAAKLDLWAVDRLLKAGADSSKFTKKRRQTAVWFVCRGDHPKRFDEKSNLIRKLVSAGCKLLGPELHWPVCHRDVELTALLLELGCPVDEPAARNEFDGPKKGDTPLTLAVENSILDIVHTVTDQKETFPRKKAEIIDRLLKAKANPNVPNGKGRTPLLLSVVANDLATAGKLLEAGADPTLCPPNCKMGSALGLAKKQRMNDFIVLFGETSLNGTGES